MSPVDRLRPGDARKVAKNGERVEMRRRKSRPCPHCGYVVSAAQYLTADRALTAAPAARTSQS